VLVEQYLQGYHGLVKTFANNIYYYQDELGSTSHIASATGALIESYQYDLYGKPRVYDSGGAYQQNATPVAKDLGNGGARWIPQLGLYDDRNRFMSPDLGRFLQPDPIGFKGQQADATRFFSNVTVYGVAYPASVAVVIPALPVYVGTASFIGTRAANFYLTNPAFTVEFIDTIAPGSMASTITTAGPAAAGAAQIVGGWLGFSFGD
jgi:RHS repeat-associated protein